MGFLLTQTRKVLLDSVIGVLVFYDLEEITWVIKILLVVFCLFVFFVF